MRIVFGIGTSIFLSALVTGAPPASEPSLLLKPVVPSSTGVRIRFPVVEERGTTMQFKAQIPKGKKKSETIEITVGIDSLPGRAFVSSKLWQSWGYEVPANKMATLPDMTIQASQLAPKVSKGSDVELKVPSFGLEIINPPGDSDKVLGCDLILTIKQLTKGADRAFEPRFYFQDRFIELTVPASAIKRPGTGDPPADAAITPDPELVVAAAPTVIRNVPVLAFASINGLVQYKTPDGKIETVNAGVSSSNDWPTGIAMTMGTARGCNVELEQETEGKGTGATFETRVLKGKVKELRLGVMTGPGLKTPKDIVIQDLTVWVDKSDSSHFVFLGPRFLETYLKDPVYACGTDGVWQLHGRIKPDLLQDVKTRPKK